MKARIILVFISTIMVLMLNLSTHTPTGNARPLAANLSGITKIAAGGYHACALTSDGGVKCWGRNEYGELGDGTNTSSFRPVNVSGLTNGVTAIGTGAFHSCALTSGGGVKCWGINASGQLGDNTTTFRNSPVNVTGLTSGISVMAVGVNHTCVLTSGGVVKCWGFNSNGQLGDGTTTNSSLAVNVSGLTGGVTAIASGQNHTCVLTSNGGIKCWGDNTSGQLGDGTTTQRFTPVDVSGLTSGVTAIAAGSFYTCALMNSGGIKCWGDNTGGQLGDGTTTQRLTPVDVSGLTSGVTAIAAGYRMACAVTSGGGVKCWGLNSNGQLGDGTTTNHLTPINVSGLSSGITAITTLGLFTCALTNGGGVKCWGPNNFGQLGDGTITNRLAPVDVIDSVTPTATFTPTTIMTPTPTVITNTPAIPLPGNLSGIIKIAVGFDYTCAVTSEGGVKCWGENSRPLGNGMTFSTTPVNVNGLTSRVIDIVAGSAHSCVLTIEGGVKCWGNNVSGQLGDGTQNVSIIPINVRDLTSGVVAISAGVSHTCALTTGGGVKCWGNNTYNKLGGNSEDFLRTIADDVIGLTSGVIAISAGGNHTCALTNNGKVKCWGNNNSGQLGNGTTTPLTTTVEVNGLDSDVIAISAGGNHTCALTNNGKVKCWGDNSFGQLGDGTTTNHSTPGDVGGLNSGSVIVISSGNDYTCVVVSGGEVKCWGLNVLGQLGDGTTTQSTLPVNVIGLTSGMVAVAAGNNHTCALTINGGVKCWGHNYVGQLGDNSTTQSLTPVDVKDSLPTPTPTVTSTPTTTPTPLPTGNLSDITQITAGNEYTCALTSNGRVKCWGFNGYGQLGDGTNTEYRTIPLYVNGLVGGITAISAGGSHVCALTSGGGAKCWGGNSSGQLGNGDSQMLKSNIPVDVQGLNSMLIAINAGNNHTCALTSGGGAKCWGDNLEGQLGNGLQDDSLSPVDVSGLTSGVIAIDASEIHTCALTHGGGVKCWGNGLYGQLGDGTTTRQPRPVDVSGLTSGVMAIDASETHTCALTSGGGVKCWGNNQFGQLGDGTETYRTKPVDVSGLANGVIAISTGYNYSCALLSSGKAKCWGDNLFGQLGDGTKAQNSRPVDVVGLTGAIAIAVGSYHACALTNGGEVKCWGGNRFGGLGDGTTTDRTTPVNVVNSIVLVPTPTPVVANFAGVTKIGVGNAHTCALVKSGGVKCWGGNLFSQFGDSIDHLTTPKYINGLTNGVMDIDVGAYHTCALTNGGGVKCWGGNSFGQLGDNSKTDHFIPTNVSGLTSGVISITLGGYHSCALTRLNEVKCWGSNGAGQLGDDVVYDHLTPVIVGGLPSGVALVEAGNAHTCILTSGGGVKCWGGNLHGQLGDGTQTNRSKPMDVSGLTSGVMMIEAGTSHTCALTHGGEVKCWGGNLYGQLGDGTTNDHYTPLTVRGLTSGVIAISAGDEHTCALMNGGGVKCWGRNRYGQLGDGTTSEHLIPVNVTGLRGQVTAISAGSGHTCALMTSGEVMCWGTNPVGQLGNGTTIDSSVPVNVVTINLRMVYLPIVVK